MKSKAKSSDLVILSIAISLLRYIASGKQPGNKYHGTNGRTARFVGDLLAEPSLRSVVNESMERAGPEQAE
jgi:hypothetical protein